MKRNLYLIAAGLVLASCTEPGDVVTGYARVITRNQPVMATPVAKPAPAPAPVAVTQPAPEQYQVVTEPAPQPISQPERAVVSQNQPIVAAPAAAPAPAPEVVVKPAPVPAPAVTVQPAPVASRATVITKSTPAPAAAPAPAPAVVQPSPYAVNRPNYTSTVSQQQPAVSAPPARPNWRTPQQVNPQKKAYPTMPGQNRGLRSKKINTYYY